MSEIVRELVLIVTAAYVGSVGYGDVYQCQIKKVLAGIAIESTIRVSILAGDYERSRIFAAHPPPVELEMGFVMRNKDEPYDMTPISGFVDRDKTSWEIVYVKPL